MKDFHTIRVLCDQWGRGIVKLVHLTCEHLFYSKFYVTKSKNVDMPQYSTSAWNIVPRSKWKIGANGHFWTS